MRPLLVLTVCIAAATADSWGPFPDRRVSSENGRYYVVATLDQKFDLTIRVYERRKGAPRLKDVHASSMDDQPPSVAADDKDALVATFRPKQTPLEIAVLDREPLLVMFDKYANVGYGKTVALVDARGKERWSVTLKQLYPRTFKKFGRTVSSIWWNDAWWVDEMRGKVVVAAGSGLVREIDLKTGAIAPAPDEVVLPRIGRGTLEQRIEAFDLALAYEPKGLADTARKVVADDKAPDPLRMRAAVALRKPGLLAELFVEHARARNKYAVAHLAHILGEKALPILQDTMRGPANDAWHAAQEGFVSLGEKAVPTLITMLLDAQGTPDYRGGAAHALSEIKSKTAVPALLRAAASDDKYTANAAVNAAIATGAPDLSKRLAALLARGSTQDGRIAMYFEEHPADHAVKPLLAALPRTKVDSFERGRILAALRKCTGKDFGDDPEAWRKGLG